MKRFISRSLLALMLSACVIQPVSAEYPKIVQQFTLGFASGILPLSGQVLALILWKHKSKNLTASKSEAISFVTGHVLGMSLWAVPWYLANTQNKKIFKD